MKYLFFFLVLLLLQNCSSTKVLHKKCYEKPQAGICKAAFPKVYFNQKTKSCESFIWGGCGGNVPFDTPEACQKVCEKN